MTGESPVYFHSHTKGYWQVSLAANSRPRTAFSITSEHWQFQVLPFGLHRSPATLQWLMDVILWPHRDFSPACLDDVVIHSSTWEDHLFQLHSPQRAPEGRAYRQLMKVPSGADRDAVPGVLHWAWTTEAQEKKVRTMRQYHPLCTFLGLVGH